MAKNLVHADARHLSLPVPDGTASGDPLIIGDLPCVAVTDEGDGGNEDNYATVDCGGSYALEVTDSATGGIAVGDILHLQTGGALNNTVGTGNRFGYALEPVGDGETATIEVKVGY